MSGLKPACKVRVNAAGDWQLMPPAGQITRIGSTGDPSFLATEDDLFISGNLEADAGVRAGPLGGTCNAMEAFDIFLMGGAFIQLTDPNHGSLIFFVQCTEEITVPVGQGAGGVWGAGAMNPQDTIILGVVTRITQAPGGGATLVSLGRSVNIDEYLDDGTVGLGDTSNSAADGDGVNVGPFYCDDSRVMKVTTNANVTGSDMKIRVTTFYIRFFPPDC